VISPLLSNIYLHYVLDEWFETEVRPRLKGRCTLVRYADDLVMAFEDFLSAKRVLAVLGKRLARYGLTLHPEKTRFIDFRFKRPNGMRHAATSGTTFDFLGFTHVWVRSRQGKDVVRQSTAKNRFARALASVSDWCRHNLHRAICEQHLHLSRVMRGICLLRHYGQWPSIAMVRAPSREDLAEVALQTRANKARSYGLVCMSCCSVVLFLQQRSFIATSLGAKLFREEPDAGKPHVRICEG
jgi:hypothetical protein